MTESLPWPGRSCQPDNAIQRARPEVVGIAHAHAFHAKIWSAFGRVLDPITSDAAMFHGDQALFQPQRPEGMGRSRPGPLSQTSQWRRSADATR